MEKVYSVISGDKISISIKYQDDISYAPICKLVFLVNSLPVTSDMTYGFYRKLLIIPFNHKFTNDEKDVDLFEKLKMEMPGIINWALEGLRRLKENHFQFSQCDAAKKALQSYQGCPSAQRIANGVMEPSSMYRTIISTYFL